MSLPVLFNRLNALQRDLFLNELLELNKETEQFGLTLSHLEIEDMIASKQAFLKGYGRVELDMELTKKLVLALCDSDYISQEDYAQTLIEIHELFYYAKNETGDQLGDENLITIIRGFYDACKGCLELLNGRELNDFIRNYRKGMAY